MKIMIFGYSGSGKSTLAQTINKEYSIKILYIDKILYEDNWKRKDKALVRKELNDFLVSNNNWIIDGNAVNILFDERAMLADKIIFMDFSRWYCYKMAKKRYKEYKNKERESRANNSDEKFNLSYKMWLLFGGRKSSRKLLFNKIINEYREKAIVIKNNEELQTFISNMDKILLK